jgi:putative tryptophan/tyrosine transport system substrate-binding protein
MQVPLRKCERFRQPQPSSASTPPSWKFDAPTMHAETEYVKSGGLMSYAANYPALFRRTAEFVDRILRGTKPAEIPVEQPTKFELAINLKTAKALGLAVPETLMAIADELVE